ncbi:MAG TPA: hypothetical protein VIS07_02000 [Candidatus Binatia bacterium]
MTPRRATLGALLAALVADPRVASACAVCFGGQENEWTSGFFFGVTLMLLLPPLIVGSAGFAIYRAIKKQEARIRERDAQRATS